MGAEISTRKLEPWTLVGAVGLFFVGLAVLAPVPVQIAPYSFITLIPAFLVAGALGESGLVVGGVIGSFITPIVFLAFAHRIHRTGNPMPRASVTAFAVLAVLSLVYTATAWGETVRYTSVLRATALIAQAVGPPILIAAAGIAIRKHLTVRRSLVLHWLACAWLAWSAFPWHGELL